MTAKITQQVVRRTRVSAQHQSFQRSWKHTNAAAARSPLTGIRFWQQGSVENRTASVAFGVIALALVGLLGFFYLQQVVGTASQGTDVQSLETQIVELKEKQRQLELEGANLRSLQAVENRVNKLNLVPTDRVSYLAGQPDKVARAQ